MIPSRTSQVLQFRTQLAPKIRPATFQDHAALIPLLARNGLVAKGYHEWQHVWTGNPFRDLFQDLPIGWVLESAEGQLIGGIENLHSLCYLNGRPLRVAVAGSWAVDREYRNFSLLLARQFFQQDNVDLLINTSPGAGVVVSKVFSLLSGKRVPHSDYDEQLIWIINYPRFAEAALRKKRIRAPALLKHPAALALRCLDAVRKRDHPWREGRVIFLADFDERFDRFWSKLVSRSKRLLTGRSRAALTWRFHYLMRQKRIFILVTEEHGEVTGYMVLALRRSEDASLREFRIVDVQVLDEEQGRLQALLLAALRLGYNREADVVRMIGFSDFKRRALRKVGCLIHKAPVWEYYYKVQDPTLGSELAREDVWDPSPFDGDSLWYL